MTSIFLKKMLAHGENSLDEYIEQAQEQGIQQVRKIVLEGSPKAMISKLAAEEVNADLIVCGAIGLNAFEKVLFDIVSEHIVRHAECDVLVIRNTQTVSK